MVTPKRLNVSKTLRIVRDSFQSGAVERSKMMNPSGVPKAGDLVVKLGGSILHRTDGIAHFQNWLAKQTAQRLFLIVGGGEIIEALRDLNSKYQLDEVEMHWRCIRLLDATFEIVKEIFPQAIAIDCVASWLSGNFHSDCSNSFSTILYLVRVGGFYFRESRECRDALPENWETTSDSLALFLARLLGIDQVVLLKSCVIDDSKSIQDLARDGIIDEACWKLCGDNIQLRIETI